MLQVTDFKMGTELLAMVDHTMKSHVLTRGQMQINLRILNLEIDAEFEHQRRGVTSESIWELLCIMFLRVDMEERGEVHIMLDNPQ